MMNRVRLLILLFFLWLAVQAAVALAARVHVANLPGGTVVYVDRTPR